MRRGARGAAVTVGNGKRGAAVAPRTEGAVLAAANSLVLLSFTFSWPSAGCRGKERRPFPQWQLTLWLQSGSKRPPPPPLTSAATGLRFLADPAALLVLLGVALATVLIVGCAWASVSFRGP